MGSHTVDLAVEGDDRAAATQGPHRLDRPATRPGYASRHCITDFVLHRPATIDDLLEVLDRHGPAAALMAGGVDVVNLLKEGAAPEHLVWLGAVSGLGSLELADGWLRVGATVTHAQFAADGRVARLLPDAPAIWTRIGSPRIRRAGTLVGNLCTGASHYDVPPLLSALGARVVAHPHAPGLLTAVEIPAGEPAVLRYDTSHKPVASVAVAARPHGDGSWRMRVAIGCAHASPVAVDLGVTPVGAELGERAGALAREVVARVTTPTGDHVASAGYRRRLIEVIVRRQLTELAGITP